MLRGGYCCPFLVLSIIIFWGGFIGGDVLHPQGLGIRASHLLQLYAAERRNGVKEYHKTNKKKKNTYMFIDLSFYVSYIFTDVSSMLIFFMLMYVFIVLDFKFFCRTRSARLAR